MEICRGLGIFCGVSSVMLNTMLMYFQFHCIWECLGQKKGTMLWTNADTMCLLVSEQSVNVLNESESS